MPAESTRREGVVTIVDSLVDTGRAQIGGDEIRLQLRRAGPGIQAERRPGEMVVFRTSRSRGESMDVLRALAAGRPQDAFRASTSINPGLVGHSGLDGRLRAAAGRGEKPVFVSPYPTVTEQYHHFDRSPQTGLRPKMASLTVRCEGKLLLMLRSGAVSFPGTWASPGGSQDPGESGEHAARREFGEEAGALPLGCVLQPDGVLVDGPHTGLLIDAPADTPRRWRPVLNNENTDWGWFSPAELMDLVLLPWFAWFLWLHWDKIFPDNPPPVGFLEKHWYAWMHQPQTWAILLPEDALIWENTRARSTLGILYSLGYCDAEFIIDANRIREIRPVDGELLAAQQAALKDLQARYMVRGGFKGVWKDKDPDIAEAARDAFVDLRLPPETLGRPFIEAPMPIPGVGGLLKGQRVLLADGQIAKINDAYARAFMGSRWVRLPLDTWHTKEGAQLDLRGTGVKAWAGDFVGLDNNRINPRLIVRVLDKGERVPKKARVAQWQESRDEVLNVLSEKLRIWQEHAAEDPQGRGDRLAQAIAKLQQAISDAEQKEVPPWL